ncbi:PAS domain S-box protein [Sphingobacterium daejeonense]|uniref:PAS domain-containing protein n=1 Tax=Sphingobacterium daejeonense TaxID=371142 RepID=UPI0021A5E904|nr:PAS domain S-box protein [Sphingobacterium daejeonense]MCT1531555.1 PAS domain S-box protein [Sphingobacterium daejeonense]
METLQRLDEIIQLKQKIKDFDSLVESIDDIIFEVSRDGVILNCWTSDPKLLFYDKEHFINKTIHEIFPSELATSFSYILEKSFKKKKGYVIKYKSPFYENPEQLYRLQTKIIGNRDDKLTAVVTNITREQKLLSKIQLKEEKFNRAFQNSSIGMLLLDRSLNVIEYNLALQKILGYSDVEEMLARKVPEFIHESHSDNVQAAFDDVKNGIRENAIIEAQCIANENKILWCLINISSVRDTSGKVIYFICQIQDLSLFKSNENKLNLQNELLEKINYELKVKVNQLEAFNQILAHNLRTPISNIEMIINQLSIETEPSQKEQLLNILKTSNKKFLNLFDKLIETVEGQNSSKSLLETSYISVLIDKLKVHFKNEIETNILDIQSEISVNTISFPIEYILCIYKYLINESIGTYKNGFPIHIVIKSWIKESTFYISIENNCNSQHCFEIASQILRDSEKIDDKVLMELHMAKQQIHYFGGSYKIYRKENMGNIVIISLPVNN